MIIGQWDNFGLLEQEWHMSPLLLFLFYSSRCRHSNGNLTVRSWTKESVWKTFPLLLCCILKTRNSANYLFLPCTSRIISAARVYSCKRPYFGTSFSATFSHLLLFAPNGLRCYSSPIYMQSCKRTEMSNFSTNLDSITSLHLPMNVSVYDTDKSQIPMAFVQSEAWTRKTRCLFPET